MLVRITAHRGIDFQPLPPAVAQVLPAVAAVAAAVDDRVGRLTAPRDLPWTA